MLERILEHNRKFVQERKLAGDDKPISGHAQKDIMVFTCMDTRLVELLEPAMGFGRGDIKILKNAGNIIRNNCSDVIRSVAVGTVLMGLKEVYVVGHSDCGMRNQKVEDIRAKMIQRGISSAAIEAIDIGEWFGLLKDESENVKDAVLKLKESPYIPKDVSIYGLLMDPSSGEIEVVI
jgi:carbonic anhydrase